MKAAQTGEARAPCRILVVEDSFDDRLLYRRLLSKKFEVTEAGGVNDGLQAALSMPFDCILLDHDLPDGTGIKFLETLRRQQPEGTPAIVMVTARGSEETAAAAMREGALDYLNKGSVTAGSIARTIENAIEKNRLEQDSRRYRQQLEKSCRALSEFAHTASHDMKAPLRHISSYCEMLRDGYGDKLGEEGLRFTGRLIVNAQRLQKLVDNLLAYSEARDAPEEKASLDFAEALREAMEFLEEAMAESGARVTSGALPTLNVYPLRMKRMLLNLVSNALKYRGQEPPVVHVSCTARESEYLFSVADNGCGIEDEYKEEIFRPFRRLHSSDKVEGSGLGLAICREIVEKHGGRIWVESVPGKGSVFFFTIAKA